jgi:Na+-driven multidrug efflux pump
VRIGLPAGIQSSLFSISNVLIQSSVNGFGDVFVTGNSAAMNIEGFVYVIISSFHHTAVTFVGQNYGAKNFSRIKKVLWSCFLGVTVTGAAAGILTYVFGRQLLSIYITDSPEAIVHGLLRMKYICLPYFICGIMDVTTGVIRGMGVSLVTMFISVFGVVGLRVGWLYTVFSAYPTPEVLFSSYTVSWTITFILQFIAFYIVYNKKVKKEQSLC